MLKLSKLAIILLMAVPFTLMAQKKQTTTKKGNTTTTATRDTTVTDEVKDAISENIAVVTIDEDDQGDGGAQNVSSVLTAGRDPFFSVMSFNFNAFRYRMRGYDGDLNTTYLNGIPMDNLDNGFIPYGLWGGLNDVMRNRDVSIGLRPSTFSFGDIGTSSSIDARASKQRKQTQIGYALSNRNYTHRLTLYHGTGISKKGWAFVFAGSFRGADEAYVPGTYYNGYSYFVGIDKRLGQKNLLSLSVFNAPTENGRQSASIEEMRKITGDNFYNPTWGLQNGKVRNANVAKSNQPTFILSDEYRFNNRTTINTAISATWGKRSTTALDWYNAPDPRPDYYRYLPSYQLGDALQQAVLTAIQTDINKRQLNWDGFFQVNRNSFATIQNANGIAGNTVSGRRSRYIQEERVIDTRRLTFNSTFNTSIGNHTELSGGIAFQNQTNNYYKEVADLLGGEFYVNLNQFAERDFPNNSSANQNDLNEPNRILYKGDKFGYDYDIAIRKASTWLQGVFKFKKVDFFLAGELSNTKFWRVGYTRTGTFPNNSFGKSAINNFDNYAVKGGVTYKINGRNYLYANAAVLTRAPLFDNVYISPRTRDFIQNNTTNEDVQTVEAGYVLNAPKLKVRLTGYYTQLNNQMNVLTFYHDGYRNFVNYAMSNIDKLQFGMEFGAEAKIIRNITLNVAVSAGRFYYNSRQNATVTVDNNASILTNDLIYSQNYRIPSTPQNTYSVGLSYRSPKFWFVSLSANYAANRWLDFNPIRRTYDAVEGLDITKPNEAALREDILAQTKLADDYTIDFFGGWNWRLPKSLGLKKTTYLVFNLGINNLLNNKNIISGGFEQLRFDYADKNVNKFPAKYYYAYGLNYFASVTLRF
ncbi:MAG: TonB-dependent receptor [Chitinophagaceae bacterium]|nr:TonB-dependent receptor [Chitinophagaceae bacterium]MCW5904756.1 TonB-dependent receptor [Chitinophagaceae bacterium]